ncbi:hypothetical protein FA95DRAFT_1278913 [Auriscalpium vulgare]|uniref:Uncharacterized protein n=1 Tax=Auriscalpium vulgare TaxID=40419 RepID=A0ACB8RT26_9AGAM|nr:hypothetical protein FA95DRAFT_1278913 [Auriscalpium vulgare]
MSRLRRRLGDARIAWQMNLSWEVASDLGRRTGTWEVAFKVRTLQGRSSAHLSSELCTHILRSRANGTSTFLVMLVWVALYDAVQRKNVTKRRGMSGCDQGAR